MKKEIDRVQTEPRQPKLGSPPTASCTPPCGAACDCAALWSEGWLMYFDSYITGKRIQQLRKTKGLTRKSNLP